jgi:hypothetical protein
VAKERLQVEVVEEPIEEHVNLAEPKNQYIKFD